MVKQKTSKPYEDFRRRLNSAGNRQPLTSGQGRSAVTVSADPLPTSIPQVAHATLADYRVPLPVSRPKCNATPVRPSRSEDHLDANCARPLNEAVATPLDTPQRGRIRSNSAQYEPLLRRRGGGGTGRYLATSRPRPSTYTGYAPESVFTSHGGVTSRVMATGQPGQRPISDDLGRTASLDSPADASLLRQRRRPVTASLATPTTLSQPSSSARTPSASKRLTSSRRANTLDLTTLSAARVAQPSSGGSTWMNHAFDRQMVKLDGALAMLRDEVAEVDTRLHTTADLTTSDPRLALASLSPHICPLPVRSLSPIRLRRRVTTDSFTPPTATTATPTSSVDLGVPPRLARWTTPATSEPPRLPVTGCGGVQSDTIWFNYRRCRLPNTSTILRNKRRLNSSSSASSATENVASTAPTPSGGRGRRVAGAGRRKPVAAAAPSCPARSRSQRTLRHRQRGGRSSTLRNLVIPAYR